MIRPINLNKARKAKAKAAKSAQSEQNRVKFGRTKAQKQEDVRLSEKAKKAIDSHRLEKDEPRS